MFRNRRIFTMKYMKEEKQAFMDCVMKKYYPEILRITLSKNLMTPN
jgi:hypothetical protein